MNTRRTKKQSYSQREVSQITSLQAYVLRYWETEFEELRPKQDRHGNRIYRIEDIKLVFHLKKLLYEDKYTIAGARQRLAAMQKSGQQMDFSFERLRQEDAVFEIKKSLREILTLLNETLNAEEKTPSLVVPAKPAKGKSAKPAQRKTKRSATANANGALLAHEANAN